MSQILKALDLQYDDIQFDTNQCTSVEKVQYLITAVKGLSCAVAVEDEANRLLRGAA